MTTVRGAYHWSRPTRNARHTAPSFRLYRTAIEWVLAQHGAVSTELDEDPRDKLERSAGGSSFGRGRGGFGRGGEDDDEDD